MGYFVELFAKAVLEVRLFLVKLSVSLSKLQVNLHLLSFLKLDFLAQFMLEFAHLVFLRFAATLDLLNFLS